MSLFVVDVAFALIMAAAGIAAGWWLCSRTPLVNLAVGESEEVRLAREVLGSLQNLASDVASELGEHSTKVQEINEELVAGNGKEPKRIVQIVAKLVDTNRSMQGRLDQVEDRLREQARMAESHAAEARTDALTLLGNRRAFDAELARRFAEFQETGRPFVLAMIDLDKFKRFNDTYGHQAGDEVLRGVGRVLRRTLCESEFSARYGGEEFALIFSKNTPDEARQTLTRVREAVQRATFDFNGTALRITTSIGGSQVQSGETDSAALVQRADEALYTSKNAGRNCVHWHDGRTISRVEPKTPEPPPAEPLPSEPEMVAAADEFPEASADTLNRTVFCQQVRSRIAECKRGGATLSLVLLEIDQRDHILRHYGQRTREAALAELGRLAQATIREMDLAARYGSSSLALLLPAARLADATRVAERLRDGATQLSVPTDEGPRRITISIGAIEVCESDNIVTLFRRAEKAVAAGHQNGGNCIYHHDGVQCVLVTSLVEA